MHAAPLSIIIPALNEALYLGATLDAVRATYAALPPQQAVAPELLVVDNGSSDDTAEVARAHGAQVISEPVRGVARARNAGAQASSGDLLLFLDADTLVPRGFAAALAEHASNPGCFGGAFDTDQRPERVVLRAYLALWRMLGLGLGMAQGAAQFCRRDAFQLLGGYDERLFMGEDVDFYGRLKRLAREQGKHAVFVREVRVVPSPRRFDGWPVWQTLIWTNPAVIALLGRRKAMWRAWYETPPR